MCCPVYENTSIFKFIIRIIIGSDRRPETKQGIEGKIVRFRSGRVMDGVRFRVRIADLNQIPDLNLTSCLS